MIVEHTGDIMIMHRELIEYPAVLQGFYAIGSGREFAIAALHLGKTAQESVEVAMVFDASTGGKIETIQRADGTSFNDDMPF